MIPVRRRLSGRALLLQALSIVAVIAVASVDVMAAPPPTDVARGNQPAATENGIALLAGVKDGTFSFDDEGFYWFCSYLREHPDALADAGCGADDAVPWQYLMERPTDYRGRAVCIEGRFLREQPAYDVSSHPDVGRLRQVDLGVAGSQSIATLVLVDPPPPTSKRSLIRTRGFFIKVRSYRTESGGEGAGPLFVARSFTIVDRAGETVGGTGTLSGRDILTLMGGVTIALFFVVVFMRRRVSDSAGTSRSFPERPRTTGTDADFDWLDEDPSITSRDNLDEGG